MKNDIRLSVSEAAKMFGSFHKNNTSSH